MKITFEITKIAALPDEWTNYKSWPGSGSYICDTEPTNIYFVSDWTVSYLFGFSSMGTITKDEPQRGDDLPESLVLRLIAAASARQDLLK